jgi:carbonic anhydrase/acetyltransferase-like protein (isoleucine patch superfamily)
MASRTVTSSVPVAGGPPADLPRIEAALAALRARFPGVIVDRYLDRVPTAAADVFVAPGAALVGDVSLGEGASVWYGCVLRGDVNRIVVGARSNLQDGTVVHLGDTDPTVVGEDVVVGHRAVLHGCTAEDGCLIGIQATVLDGCRIGRGSIVGAGAVVPAGTVVPPHSLVLGTPGKVVRTLEPALEDFHRALAGKYLRLQTNYRRG